MAKLPPTQRNIVACGGGFWEDGAAPNSICEAMLALVKVSRPRICFVGTASGDSEVSIAKFYQAFARAYPDAYLDHVTLFGQRRRPATLVEHADIVCVGGGHSTTNMLALWRLWGFDEVLRAAYERGCVMAGSSAGANIWFERYVDDCSGEFKIYAGLGWLKGCFMPHYQAWGKGWATRLKKQTALGPVYGVPDGAALLFKNEKLAREVNYGREHTKIFLTAQQQEKVTAA